MTAETGGAIKSRRAKVAFSYAAENTDELSLEPGQVRNMYLSLSISLFLCMCVTNSVPISCVMWLLLDF